MIGSFLNVCIYRIPRKEDIVFTPSHCMNCGSRVKWYDLVPVISFIILGGKCRKCRIKLSKQYPLIELLNGAAYTGIFYMLGFTWDAVMVSVLFSVLLVIAMIDFRHKIIPNAIVLFMFIVSIPYVVLVSKTYIDSIIGFFAVSGLFFIIMMITGSMGGGDVKLMAVSGFLLGWQKILVALMIGSIVGSIVGISLIVFNITKWKQRVPFGPYLCIGIFIAALFGNELIQWYLNIVFN